MEGKARSLNITREEVDAAWKAVSRAAGGSGLDGKTIEQVKLKLDDLHLLVILAIAWDLKIPELRAE